MSDLNLSLAYKLLSKCQEINKNGNVVISPLSVTLGLIAMAYGSKGNSKKQIGEVFGLETEITDQALHLVATEILSGLNEGLKIANALFADDTFSVSEDYYQNLKQGSLPLESKCVDFKTKSQDAVEEINKWVDDATDSKIKDFLQRDAVNSNTKMILVNAIHFKGKWAECFNEGSTVEKPFHKTPSESQVAKMMYLESNFYMTDCPELDCRCVELPYIQNSISCYILLPNKIDGLGYIHDNLNSDIFKSILQRIEEYKPKLALSLPKFKVGSEVDLKIVLNKLGIIDIFQAGRADLSGFSSEAKTDLYISAAIHKSIIEINEEGTEAAAATAFVISYCAYFPPEDFIVDRPFMIIIKNKKSNLVLFIGSIKDLKLFRVLPNHSVGKRYLWGWLNEIANRVDLSRIEAVGPDRAAAEWLIRCGASVKWKGTTRFHNDYNSLPASNFSSYKIEEIDATESSIMSTGFPHLKGLNELKVFKLIRCNYLEDEALPMLGYVKLSLEKLQISSCGNISDTGLKSLDRLKNLKDLYLFDLQEVRDPKDCMSHIKSNLKDCKIEFEGIK